MSLQSDRWSGVLSIFLVSLKTLIILVSISENLKTPDSITVTEIIVTLVKKDPELVRGY